jgi:transmembrane sensor
MGSRSNSTDQRIAEEAAQWLIELEEDSGADLTRFAAWLTASPRHVEEFLFASALWNALDTLDEQRRVDVEQLVAAARTNVQPLEVAKAPTVIRVPTPTGVWRALAASLVLVAVMLGLWVSVDQRSTTYSTDIGEQRALKLTDGSIVTLNTRSEAVVRFADDARNVELTQGEALFDVEHDASRPFRVVAGRVVVQAIGTQFNVHRDHGVTMISVIEGAVQIALADELSPGADARAVQLSVGEQLEVSANGALMPQKGAEIERVMAWRERRLIFRDESLAAIANEFNRYNKRQLVVEGTSTRSRRITGVFHADDPGALIAFLERDADLAVRVREDRIVIQGP